MTLRVGAAVGAALFFIGFASAGATQTVKITQNLASKDIVLGGQSITISRVQDEDHRLAAEYTKTSRPCPPFCIQPMQLAQGVQTLGELEVITFLEAIVAPGRGLLLDMRTPEAFARASIPGAVNLPHLTLSPENPNRPQILSALGGRQTSDGWEFSDALTLSLFCDGPWCGEAGAAADALMAIGYPAAKLTYYRGGLQSWLALGLTSTADQP